MFYFLKINVNGFESFHVSGDVKSASELKQNFENWYKSEEPELAFQEIEYFVAGATTRKSAGSSLCVSRVG